MTGTNNFITDLLDEFPSREATDVFINVDGVPVFAAGTNYARGNQKEKVERAELVEDLSAIGILQAEPYFLEYITATGEDLVFRVATITVEGKVAASRFTLVDRVNTEIKDALKTVNPVRESALLP